MKYVFGAFAIGFALTGCTTVRETGPAHTATEELLVSAAADRAIERLHLDFAPGTPVYIDTSYFDAQGDTSKYAIGAMREHFARAGARLVEARAGAGLIVEIRSGALSWNQRDVLIGIPSIPIPTPVTGTASFSTPELPLFKAHRRTGVAEFAAAAYRADGTLVASTGSQFGTAHEAHTVVLLVFGGGKDDYAPKGAIK